MLTPKEKAKELVNKYLLLSIDFPYNDTQDGQCIGNGYMLYNSAKQCAKIAVNEILKVIDDYNNSELCHQTLLQVANDRYYFTEVLTEIENL